MRKYIFMISLFGLLVTVAYFGMVAFAHGIPVSHKVDICHKNNGNGWSSLNVDDDSVDGFRNGDHNRSSHRGGKDIIPPFYDDGHAGYWSSRNWDATGSAIFDNGCNVQKPTPVPPTPTSVLPTATPVPPTPTLEPTATPTPTEQPTPTPEPRCEVDCITPTPTPEVTPTPEPDRGFPQPQNGGEEPKTPMCSEPSPAVQPWNFLVERAGDSATLRWIPGDSSIVDVFYKIVDAKDWQYSWTGENRGVVVIDHLNPSLGYTFVLRGRNACSDGSFISPVVVDGPQSQIFKTTYWLVW